MQYQKETQNQKERQYQKEMQYQKEIQYPKEMQFQKEMHHQKEMQYQKAKFVSSDRKAGPMTDWNKVMHELFHIGLYTCTCSRPIWSIIYATLLP